METDQECESQVEVMEEEEQLSIADGVICSCSVFCTPELALSKWQIVSCDCKGACWKRSSCVCKDAGGRCTPLCTCGTKHPCKNKV